MKKLLLFFLFLIQITCYSQSIRQFGQGLYNFRYESPLGCKDEIQSDNPNIDTNNLEILLKIFPQVSSTKYGLNNNFPKAVLLDFEKQYKNRPDFIEFAENEQQYFKENINILDSLNVSIEFLPLKELILNNYKKYYTFNEILIEWLIESDNEKLKTRMTAFSNNSNVVAIINSCNNEDWKIFYNEVHKKLRREFNGTIFLNKEVRETQKDLMAKSKVYILQQPCN